MNEQGGRARKSRGAKPNRTLDAESKGLLDEYRQRRLAQSPRLAERSVQLECDYLRMMLRASIVLGGPGTLKSLRGDPETVCKILRGGSYAKRTQMGMLAATLHLVELTVEEAEVADLLGRRIQSGLIPRPSQGQSWNRLPRTVGGSRRLQARRPSLTLEELRRVVKSAAIASPDADLAIRDTALMAVSCYSGISPNELRMIKACQVTWITPSDRAPWCASISVVRRGREVSIRVEQSATTELARLVARKRPDEYLFASARRRASSPLSYGMVRYIRILACRNAGLGDCDNVTFKRAYAAHLRGQGLRDQEIRDALGVKSISVVDRHVRRHGRLAAQRRVQWDSRREPAKGEEPIWRVLPF